MRSPQAASRVWVGASQASIDAGAGGRLHCVF